jgi:hypothetical protein
MTVITNVLYFASRHIEGHFIMPVLLAGRKFEQFRV